MQLTVLCKTIDLEASAKVSKKKKIKEAWKGCFYNLLAQFFMEMQKYIG